MKGYPVISRSLFDFVAHFYLGEREKRRERKREVTHTIASIFYDVDGAAYILFEHLNDGQLTVYGTNLFSFYLFKPFSKMASPEFELSSTYFNGSNDLVFSAERLSRSADGDSDFSSTIPPYVDPILSRPRTSSRLRRIGGLDDEVCANLS